MLRNRKNQREKQTQRQQNAQQRAFPQRAWRESQQMEVNRLSMANVGITAQKKSAEHGIVEQATITRTDRTLIALNVQRRVMIQSLRLLQGNVALRTAVSQRKGGKGIQDKRSMSAVTNALWTIAWRLNSKKMMVTA
jgi:hypothetical protein